MLEAEDAGRTDAGELLPASKLAEPLRDLAEKVEKEGKDGDLTIGGLKVIDYKVDVMIFLSDDSQEELSPETLHVGSENILYCRVKQGVFPARFTRAAYYQLAEFIIEGDGGFYLPLKGEKHLIQ